MLSPNKTKTNFGVGVSLKKLLHPTPPKKKNTHKHTAGYCECCHFEKLCHLCTDLTYRLQSRNYRTHSRQWPNRATQIICAGQHIWKPYISAWTARLRSLQPRDNTDINPPNDRQQLLQQKRDPSRGRGTIQSHSPEMSVNRWRKPPNGALQNTPEG